MSVNKAETRHCYAHASGDMVNHGDTLTILAIADQNLCETHHCHQDSMQSFGVDVALEHCGHLSAGGCTQKGGDGHPNQG